MARFTLVARDAVQDAAHSPRRASARASNAGRHARAAFANAYPTLSRWVQSYGWIELGPDHTSRSLVCVLDEGGMVWESTAQDRGLDAALQAAETAVAQWLREQFGER